MQALKKLIRFSVKNSEQKSTSLHEIDKFQIEKIVDMWAEIFSSSVLDQNQHYHILVELDFYFMMNLISISFIKFLNIFLCLWEKHKHIMLNFEDASEISSAIYKIYHLQFCIVNQWNYFLKFIQFFITINHNI